MSGVLTRNAVSDFFDAIRAQANLPRDEPEFKAGFDPDTFLFEWEQKLREAVMADMACGAKRPTVVPLNGGGLFVRED